MKKKAWRYHHFTNVNQNYDQMMYISWDMVCNRQIDRRTDGHKKWHIEVGAPPKKKVNGEIVFALISLFHVQIQEPVSRSTSTRVYYQKIFETKSRWRLKVCVCHIFASLLCMSKRGHFKKKCSLFHFKISFRSWDNQILTFQIFKCQDVIKCLCVKHETHFTE